MADEVLSQQEVASLLTAMDDGLADPNSVDSAPAAAGPIVRGRVAPYDFKRPERVGKEQMRALQTLHEGLSRSFSASFSAMLRSIVDVRLTSVDQLTYGEFVYSLENPTCFCVMQAEPLDGRLILDLNPSILYPVIDRMLGGNAQGESPARRPLTEIELRLVSRVTDLFLEELQRAWMNVVDLNLSVEQVESNPQLVQIVPPNEVVILIGFELTLGEKKGMLNFCIPFNSIEPVSNQLTRNDWGNFGRSAATNSTRGAIGRKIHDSDVQLVVTLAETSITTSDLIGLRVGDIITTEQDARRPLLVSVEGLPKYSASPGAIKGHKAFQVEELMAQADDQNAAAAPTTHEATRLS